MKLWALDASVTFFGRVSKTDRSIVLGAARNLVGSCFPVTCALDATGLVASGFTGNPVSKFASDQLWFWLSGAQDYDKYWFQTLIPPGAWTDWNGNPAAKSIQVGEGLWVIINNTPFTWTYPAEPNR